MPAISASAPGKIILFGEHAVVYGRPAIAAPVHKVQAKTYISANPRGKPDEILIDAPDIGLQQSFQSLPKTHPFSVLIQTIKTHFQVAHLPAFHLRIVSTIPIAAGMGSGAAVSVSALKAISEFLGAPLPVETLSDLAYEVEKVFHGNPSGVDNTVIAYNQPIFFRRGEPFSFLTSAKPFTIVVADCGVRSSTKEMVDGVRRNWEEDKELFNDYFDEIEAIALTARDVIEGRSPADLGALMIKNHELLRKIGVSTPELDHLVHTALGAGAQGAKLCGAGGGGNMIALVDEDTAEIAAEALHTAGAVRTIISQIH